MSEYTDQLISYIPTAQYIVVKLDADSFTVEKKDFSTMAPSWLASPSDSVTITEMQAPLDVADTDYWNLTVNGTSYQITGAEAAGSINAVTDYFLGAINAILGLKATKIDTTSLFVENIVPGTGYTISANSYPVQLTAINTSSSLYNTDAIPVDLTNFTQMEPTDNTLQKVLLRLDSLPAASVDVSVTVHQTTGDYASISAALEWLSKLHKGYKLGGVQAKILIQSGYVETVGITAKDVDLGWITIEGDTGVTSYDLHATIDGNSGIYIFDGCVAPTWKILPNDLSVVYNLDDSLFNLFRSKIYISCSIANTYEINRGFMKADDSFVTVRSVDIAVGGFMAICSTSVFTIMDSNIRSATYGGNTSGAFSITTGSAFYANNVDMYNTSTFFSDFRFAYASNGTLYECSKVAGSSESYIEAYQATVSIHNYSSTGTYTEYGLRATLSTVAAQTANFHKTGVDETTNIFCEDGSTIRVKNVTGGSNIARNSTAALASGMIIGS